MAVIVTGQGRELKWIVILGMFTKVTETNFTACMSEVVLISTQMHKIAFVSYLKTSSYTCTWS